MQCARPALVDGQLIFRPPLTTLRVLRGSQEHGTGTIFCRAAQFAGLIQQASGEEPS
jgi:hypothetical protein